MKKIHSSSMRAPRRQAAPVVAAVAAALSALACASVQAQDAVTIYGSLDAAAYSKQLSGETRMKTLTSGIMNASRWGVRGTEDLGDGLRARFDLSSYIGLDTGIAARGGSDGFWQRFAWVGLENRYGLVRLGRVSTPNFINTIRFNPFADSSLSPVFMHTYLPSAAQPMMTSDGTTDSAWSNSIALSTPSIGGFEAALQAAASEGTTAGRRLGASGAYLSNTLSVGVSVQNLSGMGLSFSKPPLVQPVDTDRSLQLGVAYDFQLVKLFGQYQRTKLENTGLEIKLSTSQFGAAVPIGVGRLLASVAHTSKEQRALADTKRDTISVGYDHFLSKRTDVYAVVATDKVSHLNRGTGVALGLRHNF
jgi:predicted porin